jgi:predicted transcriptional regulator
MRGWSKPKAINNKGVFLVTAKKKIIEAVDDLPDDATIEDAMERLLFLAKVERGLKQADAGKTIPHMEVKERMAEWLK